MRILFLTKELPYPVVNGYRMRTYHYVSALCRDHDLSVVSFGRKEECVEGLRELERLGCSVYLNPLSRDAGRLYRKILSVIGGFFSRRPYAVVMRFSQSMLQLMRHIVSGDQFDLLICDGIHMSPHVPTDIMIPAILDEHNIESTIISRYAETEQNPLLRMLAQLEAERFRRFEENTWVQFQECHVCSETDRTAVQRRSPGIPVRVVPNGVGIKAGIGTIRRKSRPSLVYTGMMAWKPNVDGVRFFCGEILPLIRKVFPDLVFSIVGRNPTEPVRRLADNRSIVVTGSVPEVETYIEQSDIVVVPLRIGSGTRLKILEAMALGKPVVATNIGAEGLNVGNGVNIVIEDTPEDFALSVIRLLSDPDYAEAIGNAGRELVMREYTWQSIENRISTVIGSRQTNLRTEPLTVGPGFAGESE